MSIHYKLDSRPALSESPIDIDEVKTHLRLFDDDSVTDDYLNSLISAAVDIASNFLGESIGESEYIAYYRNFNYIEFVHNNIDVSEVQYYNTDNVLTDVDNAIYFLDDTCEPNMLVVNTGQSFPTDLNTSRAAPVVVTYGNALGISVGPAIEQALLIIVSDLYENQSSSQSGQVNRLPTAAMSLLRSRRRERW